VPDLVEPPRASALRAPLIFEDVDEILESVGMAKFSEFAIAEIMPLNIPDDIPAHGFDILQDITVLYEPVYVRNDFEMVGISVHGSSSLTFHHGNAAGEPANFIWSRSIAAENATTDFFGRGAIAEFFVERNGINFAVTEWVTRETREPDGWVVAWAQDGQAFMASLPASYTEEEILAFCDAQSIISWELEGNAVSVSVQGMENVSIFENTGPVALSGNFDSMDNEIIVIGNALYRAGLGRSIERVGYRWLIDETLQRYQYVLQPGNYTFHAEGIIGEPGLFSRHFYSGNIVESVDFSEELANLSNPQFSLMVTEDNSELILTTTYQRLSFNLGGTPISPTNPAMILSIDVPTGANILSFLSTYHDGFPIGNPTRESYTFRGWYMDVNFTTRVTDVTIMPETDVSLYARWEHTVSEDPSEIHSILYTDEGDIIVTGVGLTSNALELSIHGDVCCFTIWIDGEQLDQIPCCCYSSFKIPFNNVTDTEATMSFDWQYAAGSFIQMWIEVYFNGEPTGYSWEITFSHGR